VFKKKHIFFISDAINLENPITELIYLISSFNCPDLRTDKQIRFPGSVSTGSGIKIQSNASSAKAVGINRGYATGAASVQRALHMCASTRAICVLQTGHRERLNIVANCRGDVTRRESRRAEFAPGGVNRSRGPLIHSANSI
jgi:hypothetical protein